MAAKYTPTGERRCESCEKQPAVARITATDANGFELDTIYLCADCASNNIGVTLLSVGEPSKPFVDQQCASCDHVLTAGDRTVGYCGWCQSVLPAEAWRKAVR